MFAMDNGAVGQKVASQSQRSREDRRLDHAVEIRIIGIRHGHVDHHQHLIGHIKHPDVRDLAVEIPVTDIHQSHVSQRHRLVVHVRHPDVRAQEVTLLAPGTTGRTHDQHGLQVTS